MTTFKYKGLTITVQSDDELEDMEELRELAGGEACQESVMLCFAAARDCGSTHHGSKCFNTKPVVMCRGELIDVLNLAALQDALEARRAEFVQSAADLAEASEALRRLGESGR